MTQPTKFSAYPIVLIVGIALLGGVSLWRMVPHRDTDKHPTPQEATMHCPHWIAMTGAWQSPGIRCLRSRGHWLHIIKKAKAPCSFATLPPAPAHGHQLLLLPPTKGAPCRIVVKAMSGHQKVLLRIPLALNQSSASDLQAIPGLHRRIAHKIVRYRRRHGVFSDLTQLLHIRGIGRKTLHKIKPYLTIAQSKVETKKKRWD